MADRPTGWISRFDNAIDTRHSIVLYGNILDQVWSDTDGRMELVHLPEWLRRRVGAHEYRRIVLYNSAERPRVLMWDDATNLEEGQNALNAMFAAILGSSTQDHSEPQNAFRVLARLLRENEHAAVIVDNSILRISEPSKEAPLLRQLTRPDASGVPARGRVIHLYTADSHIPPDFLTADPDSAIIMVSKPDFDDRKRFFDQLGRDREILDVLEGGARVDTARLARVTEGYRLTEIEHLCSLAKAEPDLDLSALQMLFRNGRAQDPWRSLDIAKIRKTLFDTVKGQDDALMRVMSSVLMARHRIASLVDESERMPAIVLALVGPTGVGKTLLARTIALAVTGSEENLKRFDMAEFQREHSDQRLIGSPPGYVGHLQGGQLTNWVLEKPCSVVLIDEWEKGADRIQDIWLEVLSGARLTDGMGQTVDFSNVILIFTSNIGGSESRDRNIGPDTPYAEVEQHFKSEVERFFAEDLGRPEIYGRVKGGIVVFRYIDETTARKAIEQRLRKLTSSVEKRLEPHLRFSFEPNHADPPNDDQTVVNELLAVSGYQQFGLRDVNNVVKERVGGNLAVKMEELTARIERGQSGFKARLRWKPNKSENGEKGEVEVVI